MRRSSLAALVLLFFAAPAVRARPLMETPTPTPVPPATTAPLPTATPAAAATATPGPEGAVAPGVTPTPSPIATPIAAEGAAVETTSGAMALPPGAAVATTSGTIAAPPAVIDYAAGMPGSAPGPHPLRGFLVMGFHVFTGQGWDRKNLPVGVVPIRSADYVGGALGLGAIYDVAPALALVASGGGYNGQHTADTGIGTSTTTVSFNTWWTDAAVRAQTPADIFGLWIQAGPGAALSRKTVTSTFNGNTTVKTELRGAATFHIGAGLSWHLAQGLELFGEMRWLTAQGRFPGDMPLDMGGIVFDAGGSLRL